MARAKNERHPAEQYARRVVDGKIVAGQLVRRACERHLHDLARGDERGLRFDADAAQHVLDFYGFLRHSKGRWGGKPFVLEPWQQFGLWCQFGWKRHDGLRRFRTGYKSVARKNGKSTMLSGSSLYLFLADSEPGAEVYAAATTLKQATIVFEEAKKMVLASPEIKKRVEVLKNNMHVASTASKFEPLCSAPDTNDGWNVHAASIDELHAHKTRDIWDVIETATGARDQPMIDAITTAGFNQDGICYELRQYGITLLNDFDKADGVHDDTFFFLDYTLDPEDDWRDAANWPKANPNLDVSVYRDDLERKSRKAQQIPTAQNNYRTKHLNEWRQQDILWLDMDRWDACAGKPDLAALRRQPCYAGLDLSKTRDTTAFVLVFQRENGYDALPFFFMPEEGVAEAEKRDRMPYRLWAQQGLLELTSGRTVNYRRVRERIRELSKDYSIREIAYDPWQCDDTRVELEMDGFAMIECRQGYRTMTAPCKELETLLVDGRLRHGGHPILRWMASNVSVRDDGNGNIRPVKPNDRDSKKIDGIVALVMAISRAMVNPDSSGPNVFTL